MARRVANSNSSRSLINTIIAHPLLQMSRFVPLMEFRPHARRRGETEVAARDHRFAAAVACELLGLALLGARVDGFRRQLPAQLCLALHQHRGMARVGREV